MTADLFLDGGEDTLPATGGIELYPWQAQAVEQLRENMRKGIRSQILSAPTGSGKTEIAGHILDAALRQGTRCLFVVDRKGLVEQTSERFTTAGIPHGIIQADNARDRPWEKLQVCSAQTLARRSWPDARLVFVDECHTVYTNTVEYIKATPAYVIGLSATPFTLGLGKYYTDVVTVRTTNQLIQEKRLAPYTIYAPDEPDMRGVTVNRNGEWTQEETTDRALRVVGNIPEQYLKFADGRRFVAFGATKRHCEAIQAEFQERGIYTELYVDHTPDTVRREHLANLRDPMHPLQGLISVAALAKGFDAAYIDCIIIARPLRKSLAEHIQIFGRGIRWDPANPEKRCIILDHAGNCKRFFGPMMDFFEHGCTELDKDERKDKAEKKDKQVEAIECPKCTALHLPRPVCPHCGHEYPKPRALIHEAGELSPLTGMEPGSRSDKESFYRQLMTYQREVGYKESWVAMQFQKRFRHWPVGYVYAYEAPTLETRMWIRTQLLEFKAHRKKRRGR